MFNTIILLWNDFLNKCTCEFKEGFVCHKWTSWYDNKFKIQIKKIQTFAFD